MSDAELRMIDNYIQGAHVAIMCEIVAALIEAGVLRQGDVISRFEKLAKTLADRPGAQYSVPVVDIVRDFVANEQNRKPS